MFDADPTAFQLRQPGNIGGGGGDDGLNYTLDCNFANDTDKPVKLIWEITTRTEEIDLPFEFHDLPLVLTSKAFDVAAKNYFAGL